MSEGEWNDHDIADLEGSLNDSLVDECTGCDDPECACKRDALDKTIRDLLRGETE